MMRNTETPRKNLMRRNLDSVHSEMVCHKHYAERGVDLKRGVDY